jgi:hypothetical protein
MSSILKVDTIQDQDGNNIINESANTITIGASGDTITIPSGATFASTGIDDNATSTAITIDSSGSVGIGTSSPSAELHISKSADAGNAEFLIENSFATAGSTDEIVQIQGRFGGFDASYIITGKEADFTTSGNRSSFMSFWTRGAGTLAEAMRINSSGNVGIGTSSPEVPLSVVGLDTQIHFSESADSGGYLMSEAAGQFRISGGAAFKVGNTAWTAKSTEAAIIGHDSGGDIKFFSNTGLTVGNNFTPTERMRIDSSGRVGIGTSSPSLASGNGIVISGGSSVARLELRNTTSGTTSSDGGFLTYFENDLFLGNRESGNSIFYTNNAERMRIDSAGSVGIGNTTMSSFNSEANNLVVGTGSGDEGITIYTGSSAGQHGSIFFADGTDVNAQKRGQIRYEHNNEVMSFFTNTSERLRIASNGRQTYNSLSTASGHGNFVGEVGASYNALAFEHTNGGGIIGTVRTTASSTAYNTSSDYRLKENVNYDFDATSRLKQLKPARFNFIADANTTVDGFLAHEVSSIVPEAISGEKDAVDENGNPEYQGIDQSKLVPLLVKTIQELEARITALETTTP